MPSPQDSKAEGPEDGRRFLIVAGTGRYTFLTPEEQLPSVPEDLQRIVALFTERGYAHVLPELTSDPSSWDLHTKLSDWFADPDRSSTDIVVFYYSGHGFLQRDKHYLLTSESRIENLVGTAFRARELGEMLDQTPLQRVLVILDTCYSGQGTAEIAAVSQTLLDALDLPHTPGAGFYALAAARSREEAGQQVFSLALDAVVRKPDASYAGARQPYLPLDALVGAINADFAANSPDQHARLNAVNIESPPRFIPNPNYRPESQLPIGIDIETQQRILSRYRLERVTHWGPHARGVESETQPGWYFTGRVNALRELVAWLSAPQGDSKARVVTGDPGSGKSALLARLVTLSDPEYRRKAPLSDIPPETIPPEGCIQIALYARQKTLEQLVATLATETGIEETEPELLIAALAERGAALTIVLDALDEALDPAGVAQRLLQPLTMVGCVKLLIGTRRPSLKSLGPAVVVIDLDSPSYIERADIQEYVQRRLLAADDPTIITPYRGLPEVARRVGEEVAERAFPVFLIARLISYELMQAKAPVDPNDPTWSQSLPASVGDAFGQFLSRFGPNEERATDLLRPLAYAQGGGLPWESFWAPVASAIAGKSYGDGDIIWLRDHAGAYIVEGLERERSAYRLYHQALAEYLHRTGQDSEIHRRIVEVLLAQTPVRNANGEKDWLRAHPYLRAHLATHAAAAGMLGSLTSDPLYLLTADPDRLLVAFGAPGCNAGSEESHVYQAAFNNVRRARTPEDASSYLEMEARKSGIESLADAIAALPLKRPWSVPWAQWQPEGTHRTLQGHKAGVTSIALGTWQGRTVIVSGSSDGEVWVWDLGSGTPIGKPLHGQSGAVNPVAVGTRQGRTIVVSTGDDNTVRLWDLATGAPIGESLTGHTGTVTSVVLGEFQGRTVIVSGSYDDTIRLWDLTTGAPIGEPLKAFESWVKSVDIGESQGKTLIVSGGRDRKVRRWDPAIGALIGEPLIGHAGEVTSVALGESQGRTVLVSGSNDNTVRVWDPASGVPIGEPLTGRPLTVESVDVGEWSGRTVIVSGGWDWLVQVWDLERHAPIGDPLQGHTNTVSCVALGEWQGRTVIVSGSWDQAVRIWDPATSVPPDESLSERPGWVMCVATGAWQQGRTAVVTGGYDHTVRAWDMATGAPIGAPFEGHSDLVNSVALGDRQGRSVVVSGSYDNTIRVWDLATGAPIGEPLRGHEAWINSVAVGEWQGQTVIVSGSWDKTIRIWDLASGSLVGEPLRGHDDAVYTVALGEWQGRTVIISGSKDTTIRLWDLATGAPIGEPFRGHTRGVLSVALGECEGRAILVSSGEEGAIRVWDPVTGAPIGAPFRSGVGAVHSVALGKWAGKTVIVSADNCVRIWNVDGSSRLVIDIGTYVYKMALTTDDQIVVGTRMGLLSLRIASPSQSA